MRFEIRFGGLNKIKENIQKEFGSKGNAKELVDDILRVSSKRCLSKIIKRTPSDTGNLRKNWKMGNVRHRGFYSTVTIENKVEYTTYIEYGHRATKKQMHFLMANKILDPSKKKRSENGWYKGHFMVKNSVEEIKKDLPNIAEERMIKKFLEIFP